MNLSFLFEDDDLQQRQDRNRREQERLSKKYAKTKQQKSKAAEKKAKEQHRTREKTQDRQRKSQEQTARLVTHGRGEINETTLVSTGKRDIAIARYSP